MRTLPFLAVPIALAGCAAPVSGIDEQIANHPLICEGSQDCTDMWQRAQYFVTTNAGMKIQTATDTVIETYNTGPYSSRWVFKVTKEPLGSGKSRIRVAANCGGFLCKESEVSMIAKAKNYIGNIR